MFKLSELTRAGLLVVCLTTGLGLASVTQAADAVAPTQQAEEIKVVYHINNAASQALGGLRSMRNHLDVAPDTRIVVVAHGDGIDFLTTAYEAAETVGPLIAGLAARGVAFEVCEITMARQELTPDDFVLEADFVPSGVARISQLQAHEHYVYMKP